MHEIKHIIEIKNIFGLSYPIIDIAANCPKRNITNKNVEMQTKA